MNNICIVSEKHQTNRVTETSYQNFCQEDLFSFSIIKKHFSTLPRQREWCFQKDKAVKKKKNDREKSYCGLEMQRPLNTNLAIGKEFQAICRNWYKSFQTSKQIFRKKKKQLAKSRVQHKKKNVVPMHKKSTLKLKLR